MTREGALLQRGAVFVAEKGRAGGRRRAIAELGGPFRWLAARVLALVPVFCAFSRFPFFSFPLSRWPDPLSGRAARICCRGSAATATLEQRLVETRARAVGGWTWDNTSLTSAPVPHWTFGPAAVGYLGGLMATSSRQAGSSFCVDDDGFRGGKWNQSPCVLGVSTAALVGICRVEVNGGRKLGSLNTRFLDCFAEKSALQVAGPGTKLLQLPLCPRVGVTACGEIGDQRGLFGAQRGL